MTVGFIINGFPEHGIVRVSAKISEALAALEDVKILSTLEAVPSAAELEGLQNSIRSGVLVFHASHRTDYLWGPYQNRIPVLSSALASAKMPVVLYLHDIYCMNPLRNIIEKILCMVAEKPLARVISYQRRFMRAIDPHVNRYIVSNDIEKERLGQFVRKDKVSVLPHFIETRRLPCDASTAKAQLGFSGKKIVTLLGFIVERKGYEDAIDCLSRLPTDVHMVFAGKGSQVYIDRLMTVARDCGVDDRLTITGLLTEDDLNMYMAATDVALCPFHDVSASGSVCTWLSAGKVIVSYDLPLMHDYSRKFPAHLRLVKKSDTNALAQAVKTVLSEPAVTQAANIEPYNLENTAARLSAILRETEAGQ